MTEKSVSVFLEIFEKNHMDFPVRIILKFSLRPLLKYKRMFILPKIFQVPQLFLHWSPLKIQIYSKVP